jgi:phosphoribosylamine---glycine ligase
VVLASGGYPGKFEVGKRINGLTAVGQNSGVKILHAGTKRDGAQLVTNGGRVLGVTASGASLNAALSTAYKACSKIQFDGMHYRKDIGSQSTRLKAAGD